MRAARLVWIGLAGGCLAAVWALADHRAIPSSQQPIQPADLPTASSSPPPVSAGPDAGHPIDAADDRRWVDPSIEPAVLERAFAPPPRSLPEDARPERLPIHPPERDWREAQRDEDAIAY